VISGRDFSIIAALSESICSSDNSRLVFVIRSGKIPEGGGGRGRGAGGASEAPVVLITVIGNQIGKKWKDPVAAISAASSIR
jgi:hypothetical protein